MDQIHIKAIWVWLLGGTWLYGMDGLDGWEVFVWHFWLRCLLLHIFRLGVGGSERPKDIQRSNLRLALLGRYFFSQLEYLGEHGMGARTQ
jgi:hypothetical protein